MNNAYGGAKYMNTMDSALSLGLGRSKVEGGE